MSIKDVTDRIYKERSARYRKHRRNAAIERFLPILVIGVLGCMSLVSLIANRGLL